MNKLRLLWLFVIGFWVGFTIDYAIRSGKLYYIPVIIGWVVVFYFFDKKLRSQKKTLWEKEKIIEEKEKKIQERIDRINRKKNE
jgi:uncharacterized membrane protein